MLVNRLIGSFLFRREIFYRSKRVYIEQIRRLLLKVFEDLINTFAMIKKSTKSLRKTTFFIMAL